MIPAVPREKPMVAVSDGLELDSLRSREPCRGGSEECEAIADAAALEFSMVRVSSALAAITAGMRSGMCRSTIGEAMCVCVCSRLTPSHINYVTTSNDFDITRTQAES